MLGLNPSEIISRIFTLLIAFSVHEFAHAWTANFFGDDTPRLNGRLTLNPGAHLDPLGTLMLVVSGFGWARPVPVNPYALQRRSSLAMMWVSLAGPFSNFLLAIIAAIPLRLGLIPYVESTGPFPSLAEFLFTFIIINLSLMLFNLIPLAPLDGEKIASTVFPPSMARTMDTIRPYSPLILMVLLFVMPSMGLDIIGWIMRPAMYGLLNLLGV